MNALFGDCTSLFSDRLMYPPRPNTSFNRRSRGRAPPRLFGGGSRSAASHSSLAAFLRSMTSLTLLLAGLFICRVESASCNGVPCTASTTLTAAPRNAASRLLPKTSPVISRSGIHDSSASACRSLSPSGFSSGDIAIAMLFATASRRCGCNRSWCCCASTRRCRVRRLPDSTRWSPSTSRSNSSCSLSHIHQLQSQISLFEVV